MSVDIDNLIAQRAERLAYLALTRRNDLSVFTPLGPNVGIDFLVHIHDGNGVFSSSMEFGVAVKGRQALNKATLPPTLQCEALKQPDRFSQSEMPVCAFLFFMDEDVGYYSWMREPIVHDGARLQNNEDSTFAHLDDAALDDIVARVKQWYRHRNAA